MELGVLMVLVLMSLMVLNDYVDCGDMDETEDVSELTISVWVKPQDVLLLEQEQVF